jgi:ATP-dependent Clp protease adapter protein ClpS
LIESTNFLLYNDSVNYQEHVVASLVNIVGSTELPAYKVTKAVHEVREAILGLYEKELAELHTFAFREQAISVKTFPVVDFQYRDGKFSTWTKERLSVNEAMSES